MTNDRQTGAAIHMDNSIQGSFCFTQGTYTRSFRLLTNDDDEHAYCGVCVCVFLFSKVLNFVS